MLFQLIPQLLILALYVASALGLGYAQLKRISWNTENSGETLLVSLALGLAWYSLVLFFMGFFSAWTLWGALALVSPGGLLLLIHRQSLSKEFKETRHHSKRLFIESPIWGKGCFVLLLLLLLVEFVACAVPPTGRDAIIYHLSLPKVYAQERHWVYRPDLFFADNPLAPQMHFMAARLLGAADAAPLLHWFFGVLFCLGIYYLMREVDRSVPRVYALLAAALVVSMPLFAFESTSAFVDLAVGLYALLAVWLGLRSMKSGSSAAAMAAGIALGTLAASKVSGVILWPAWVAMVGATLHFQRLQGKKWHLWVLSAFWAALFSFPWYIKAWWFAGNPIWPMFYSVLGGRYWSVELDRVFKELMRGQYGYGTGALSFIKLPWDWTLHADRFDDGPFGMSLFILPCLSLFWARKKELWPLWIFLVVYLPIWFMTSQQARFLIPIFPVWAVLVSRGWFAVKSGTGLPSTPSNIRFQNRLGYYIPGSCIALSVLIGALGSLYYSSLNFPAALGLESKEAYLQRTYPFYQDVQFVNQKLPPNAKILVTDPSIYYLDREFIRGVDLQGFVNYGSMSTAEDLYRRLRQLHVTHVWLVKLTYENESLKDLHTSSAYYRHTGLLLQGLTSHMKRLYHRKAEISLRRSGKGPKVPMDSAIYSLQ
jgi:hypothetical protein